MVAIIANIRSASVLTTEVPAMPASRPAPVRNAASAPGALPTSHLSRREQEILPLLAARWTDREIADALCISYRTATTHVTHIFNKLGVTSRRDLTSVMRG
jgi:non-specific serine/threonine protein kinase